MAFRLIVTGARDWTNKLMVISALHDVCTHYGPYVLVHGNCPTGVDSIAEDWYQTYGKRWAIIDRVKFPALWDIEGHAAGPLRNGRMVRAGADLGLAFPLGDSRGTRDCMRKMKAARIPVRVFDFKSGMYRVAT